MTEEEIREAVEEYDGSFYLSEEYIPFDAKHRADARALVLEKLEDSVLVRQEKLGGNCTAVVAVKLTEEETEGEAAADTTPAESEDDASFFDRSEIKDDSAGALVENVFMIGMNGGSRACEFVLEIETDGGIVVEKLYVDKFIGIAGGPGVETAAGSDGAEKDYAASPSGAEKATSSDAAADGESGEDVMEAGLATPVNATMHLAQTEIASASEARVRETEEDRNAGTDEETDDETDDEEEEYEDVDLVDDLSELYATPSNLQEEDPEEDRFPYGVFREAGTDVLEGEELDGLVKQSGEHGGFFRMLARAFFSDEQDDDADKTEQKENEAPAFQTAANGIVVLKTSRAAAELSADTREDILKQLAEVYGIYPGTKTANDEGEEVWTAYDAGEQDDASTKVTVTFPKEIEIPDNYFLYLRRVNDGDPYYPDEEAVKESVGGYNDLQCWAIHWVEIKEEGDVWKSSIDVNSVLELKENAFATVRIEYQKEEACLEGLKGQRKLHVYNSRAKNGKTIEEVGELTDVTATGDAYTGFTYKTNRGGPYVFVNNKLYEGYVSSLDITEINDGSSPFDPDDKAGNDSGDKNKIVRSYDVIQYLLTVNFAARQNSAVAKKAQMGFEMTMNADITAAVFDTSQMLWLGNHYIIEYLDENGGVVLKQTPDGKITDAYEKEVSPNDIVSGSNEGKNSYTTRIARQRLRAEISLEAEENILAANQTFRVGVQVLGAHNNSKIQPTFRAWLAGNEDNYGSESTEEGDGVTLAGKVTDNEKTADEVRVSAAARFNLELAKNAAMSYKSWFDSSKRTEINSETIESYTIEGTIVTGKELYSLLEKLASLDENMDKANPEKFTDNGGQCTGLLKNLNLSDYEDVFKNIRYGRITGYGITFQIYNQASDDQNAGSKGFKGVSLPQGDVSFDLDLKTSISDNAAADGKQYYSQLWEYKENLADKEGNSRKNMYWANLEATKYAAWAAPYNSGNSNNACYDGGNWTRDPDSKTYHFTVNSYNLNFLPFGLGFPTHKAGNASATTGYNTYIGCVSAGYVQVLNVFPRKQSVTLNMGTSVVVKNLALTTVDGTEISAADKSNETGYDHESNTGDNKLNDDIPLYAKGGMTKANAFCTAALFDNKDADFTGKDYFLGTYFWGTSYDCSAFAGQDVTLVGAARINAGDYQIRHMNILQLFDSEALSINTNKDEPYVFSKVENAIQGETTILYAADPDYRGGYDTQKKDVMKYMNTVQEEDLIYYESLDELKKAGYQCVGVMAELRNCTIDGESGYKTTLRIPMKVSESNKFVGKTVGTVNSVRIWTNEQDMDNGKVSWKNGVYDESREENSVEGYTDVNVGGIDHYSGEVSNQNEKDFYEKTEYDNGQVKLGTNTGGYVRGSSLLILSYKSEVGITVDNGGAASLPTFDLDKGNYTVNYRLKDIIAKRDETNGNAQVTNTDLTVVTKLDTPWEENGSAKEQRIAVAANTYLMKPSSEKMRLVDEYGNELESQSAEISTDPKNPTTVYYAFIDESKGEIDKSNIYKIQVYAESDTNGKQVTFTLKDVTVGISVPDITYDANITPQAVKDNDRIQTDAYISGSSDVRAYSETAGNKDSVTIGIVQLSGTRLVKAVDQSYIELDGDLTYTVTYTNSGKESVSFYLYDLKPYPKDKRGSNYDGRMILKNIAAELSGEGGFTAEIDFYYSTMGYEELYEMVKDFGKKDNEDTSLEDRLKNVDKMLSDEAYFKPLGKISSAKTMLDCNATEELKAEMRSMTGLYAVVKNLGGNRSLSIKLQEKTEGSKAGNLYRNVANSWLGDNSEPLTSNVVETSVLSRTISGVVWYDKNLNGVRDSDEDTISDVTCTLFKLSESGKYEQVSWKDGPNGRTIDAGGDSADENMVAMSTGENGSYRFSNLAAGNYIVAFSGDGLKNYTGAAIYQVNGENDKKTNDAVALFHTEKSMGKTASIYGIDGETYSYAIAYSLSDEDVVEAVPLHTIDEIVKNNIKLTNDVELHENLDCGLVIVHALLPKTGGRGTYPYYGGGVMLILVCFVFGISKRRRDMEGGQGAI